MSPTRRYCWAHITADWHPRRYAEETAAAIDVAVRGIIDTAFKSAAAILTANRAVLDEAAAVLLTKETLAGKPGAITEHVVKATAAKKTVNIIAAKA